MTEGIIQKVFEPRLKRLAQEPPKCFTYEQRMTREAHKEILEAIQQELITEIKKKSHFKVVGMSGEKYVYESDLIGDNQE